MCRQNCTQGVKPVTGFQEQPQAVKSNFRLSPFRKVAKTARINLNRYWGILSQSAAMKPLSPSKAKNSESMDFSKEMEQNRINEMLEAQNEAAISDNERNSEYENSPDFHQSRRQVYTFRSNSVQSWSFSDASSFASDCFDTISQDSVFL